MSFANSSVQNSYKPDTRVLNAITALTARVATLEAEKTAIQAENTELRTGLELLYEWAKTLTHTTTSETSGGSWLGSSIPPSPGP